MVVLPIQCNPLELNICIMKSENIKYYTFMCCRWLVAQQGMSVALEGTWAVVVVVVVAHTWAGSGSRGHLNTAPYSCPLKLWYK